MGRKRKVAQKKKKVNENVLVIVLFILSIILFVVIYGNAGTLGEILSPSLGGIIGWIKYLLPFGTLVAAVGIAKDDDNYLLSKLFQCIIVLTCIAALFSIFQLNKSDAFKNQELTFEGALESAYDIGKKNVGGGTVGTFIAYPLISFIGVFASSVLLIGVILIIAVFNFGFKPAEYISDALKERDEARLRRQNAYANQNGNGQNLHSNSKIMNLIKDGDVGVDQRRKINNKANYEPGIVDEDQITINLNDRPREVKKEEPVPEKGKLKIFGRNDKPEEVPFDQTVKEEVKAEANPNEIESNLFKQEKVEKEEKTQQVLNLEHNTMETEYENYEIPPTSLLQIGDKRSITGKKTLTETATRLQKTLYSFGVSAKVENVSVGPAITRYELKPAEGVRVSKIAKLADDIALNLAAESIRIEAPIPGKQAVGIEIPNKEKQIVPLRDILEADAFIEHKSKLAFALGKDVGGEPVVADIAKMPHVLIAGSTGSGKSVCINTLITSIIYKAKPNEVKLVMVDPKVVELSVYNGIPHLLIPVVTDPKKAAGALQWAVQEMVNRYALFAEKNVRDIKGYNEVLEKDNPDGKEIMPQIVIIIDELADLMMVAPNDVEDAICRLAQKARAAGMHLVIATQRPSVDVITGIIKANIPSRIAFAVSSQIDSRTILDQGGAEKLLGKGDMLFYPIGASKPTRVQGAFVSDKEVEKIVDFVKPANGGPVYNPDVLEKIENANKSDQEKENSDDPDDDTDPLLNEAIDTVNNKHYTNGVEDEAIDTVIDIGQASTSFIQRRFKVGYARAGRIIDQMEARGIISGYQGSKPREVIITKERWQELNMMQPPANESDNNINPLNNITNSNISENL